MARGVVESPTGAGGGRSPGWRWWNEADAAQLTIGGVVLGCWALAGLLAVVDGGRLLDHGALFANGMPAPLALVLFVVAWQVMIGAMMLPTSLPMVVLFARVSSGQPHPARVLAAFLAAYAAVWTAFALLALAGDAALHALAARSEALTSRPTLLVGLALVLAGAFQFSPLKEQCLRTCRHPLSFLTRHYQRGIAAAWRLGLRHGLYCLGCCWALMLVLFAVGAGNLAWMAALTGVMLVEKTARRGRRLVPVVGLALLASGGLALARAWLGS